MNGLDGYGVSQGSLAGKATRSSAAMNRRG